MKTEVSQWKKRVAVFKFIYSALISDWSLKVTKDNFVLSSMAQDAYIVPIMIEYLKNFSNYLKLIESCLEEEWSLDRIAIIDLAIILSSLSEFDAHQLDRKIIIDQAIITSKNYGDSDSYKFVNSILDKLLR